MESKLKKLRQEQGISQEKCARDIGISVRTLQRYENQDYIASAYCMAKLCKYFNVSMEDLLPDTAIITKNSAISNEKEHKEEI